MPPNIQGKRVAKRPRVGEFFDGATGIEEVLQVWRNGEGLKVRDAIGREWRRYRVPRGHWVIYPPLPRVARDR